MRAKALAFFLGLSILLGINLAIAGPDDGSPPTELGAQLDKQAQERNKEFARQNGIDLTPAADASKASAATTVSPVLSDKDLSLPPSQETQVKTSDVAPPVVNGEQNKVAPQDYLSRKDIVENFVNPQTPNQGPKYNLHPVSEVSFGDKRALIPALTDEAIRAYESGKSSVEQVRSPAAAVDNSLLPVKRIHLMKELAAAVDNKENRIQKQLGEFLLNLDAEVLTSVLNQEISDIELYKLYQKQVKAQEAPIKSLPEFLRSLDAGAFNSELNQNISAIELYSQYQELLRLKEAPRQSMYGHPNIAAKDTKLVVLTDISFAYHLKSYKALFNGNTQQQGGFRYSLDDISSELNILNHEKEIKSQKALHQVLQRYKQGAKPIKYGFIDDGKILKLPLTEESGSMKGTHYNMGQTPLEGEKAPKQSSNRFPYLIDLKIPDGYKEEAIGSNYFSQMLRDQKPYLIGKAPLALKLSPDDNGKGFEREKPESYRELPAGQNNLFTAVLTAKERERGKVATTPEIKTEYNKEGSTDAPPGLSKFKKKFLNELSDISPDVNGRVLDAVKVVNPELSQARQRLAGRLEDVNGKSNTQTSVEIPTLIDVVNLQTDSKYTPKAEIPGSALTDEINKEQARTDVFQQLQALSQDFGLRVEYEFKRKKKRKVFKFFEPNSYVSVLEMTLIGVEQINISRNNGQDIVAINLAEESEAIKEYISAKDGMTMNSKEVNLLVEKLISKISQASSYWQQVDAEVQRQNEKNAGETLNFRTRVKALFVVGVLLPAYFLFERFPQHRETFVIGGVVYGVASLLAVIKGFKDMRQSKKHSKRYFEMTAFLKESQYFESTFSTSKEYSYVLNMLDLARAKLTGDTSRVSSIRCSTVFSGG